MESTDGAAGPVGFAVFQGNYQRGAAIALDDARGGDADDAAMPAFALDYGAVGGAQRGVVAEALDNGGKDFPLGVLAVSVELVEASGDVAGLRGILGGEEIDDAAGHVHASGGIDARADAKADVGGGERAFAVELGDFEEGFESGVDGLAQASKAEFGEDAVLSGERDDIGDGADGGDFEERRQQALEARSF